MEKSHTKKGVKDLWDTEEIRVLILMSLLIQTLLTFLAPCRKTNSKSKLKVLLWMLYLLADVIALYIIGLISNYKCHNYDEPIELLALWASFLLLHLGGPDTITALALEDNELWRRHALQLATQVFVTVIVFYRSLRKGNPFWIPTVLMFVVGFIKYFERTCALFYSSADNFKDSMMTDPDPGPNFARLMEEYFAAKSANIPAGFEGRSDGQLNRQQLEAGGDGQNVEDHSTGGPEGHETKDEIDDLVIKKAHWVYKMFKPFLAEEFLSLKDRNKSRDFFLSMSKEEDISRIIQIELNLIYDAFYTKSFLLWTKRGLARLLCFVLVVVSLVMFSRSTQRAFKIQETDAIITFILFSGAIALDISAAIMFVLSDWWVILAHGNTGSFKKKIMLRILSWSRWARQRDPRRWSQTISQYNLLRYCVWKLPLLLRLGCIFNMKLLKDIIIQLCFVKVKKADEKLMPFIIKEIRDKARLASDVEAAKDAFSARGNMVLGDEFYLAAECLRPWTVEVDYDESLMIWHLATDICYWMTDSDNSTEEQRDISKKLSDYMLYLAIWQQSLLSTVVGMSSKSRFQDTCAVAKNFMNHKTISISWRENFSWKDKIKSRCRGSTSSQDNHSSRPSEILESEHFKKFSKRVLKNSEVLEPIVTLAKADKSKAVLYDACRLAKQLQMFGVNKWKITSKVWVELMCYAAARCSPRYHIARLSKGGELITFVWLLMAHLGLGERFLQHKGYGWTRLIIGK